MATECDVKKTNTALHVSQRSPCGLVPPEIMQHFLAKQPRIIVDKNWV